MLDGGWEGRRRFPYCKILVGAKKSPKKAGSDDGKTNLLIFNSKLAAGDISFLNPCDLIYLQFPFQKEKRRNVRY